MRQLIYLTVLGGLVACGADTTTGDTSDTGESATAAGDGDGASGDGDGSSGDGDGSSGDGDGTAGDGDGTSGDGDGTAGDGDGSSGDGDGTSGDGDGTSGDGDGSSGDGDGSSGDGDGDGASGDGDGASGDGDGTSGDGDGDGSGGDGDGTAGDGDETSGDGDGDGTSGDGDGDGTSGDGDGDGTTGDGDGDGDGTFQISDQGPSGSTSWDANDPAVAYSATSDRYLVVWFGRVDPTNELEIYGRYVEGNGAMSGIIRLTNQGPDGDAAYSARYPAVAWNSFDDEFGLFWEGSVSGQPGKIEIHGQRIDAGTMTFVGIPSQISVSGGDETRDAFGPAVAFDANASQSRWWVAYHSDSGIDNDFRVLFRTLAADFSASTTVQAASTVPSGRDAQNAAIAWNSTDSEALIVWDGDHLGADDEFEISGQRVDQSGALVGSNFRISDVGTDGDDAYDATFPSVAYDDTLGEYLVAWHGDDDANGGLNDDNEIFAQRLGSDGTEIGTNDFRVSDMGAPGDQYGASKAHVTSRSGVWEILWSASHDAGLLVPFEFEVWGQTVSNLGLVGSMERITTVGFDGDPNRDAYTPAAAWDGTRSLVVWSADDPPLSQGEFEIFGGFVAP